MPFERSCLYHPRDGMRVIEASQEEEYNRLLKSGLWFDHPTKAKLAKEVKEKPKAKPSVTKVEPAKTEVPQAPVAKAIPKPVKENK